jgi:predicted acyl esterase
MKNYYLLRFCDFNQPAQDNSPSAVGENYTKKEVHIKMRDGVSLYTVIYTPKDHSKKYPISCNAHLTAVRLMVLISLRKVSVQVKP